jgi:hypothetical protein
VRTTSNGPSLSVPIRPENGRPLDFPRITVKALAGKLSSDPLIAVWFGFVAIVVGIGSILWTASAIRHDIRALKSSMSASQQDRDELHREIAEK